MSQFYDFVQPDQLLQQGDILYKCPVFFPHPQEDYSKIEDPGKVKFTAYKKDLIVMTQSCDIQQAASDPNALISVCPLASISSLKKTQLNSVLTNQRTSVHLLNEYDSDKGKVECQMVDFSHVYTIPLGVINNWKLKEGKLIPRLKSPYTELMSQRFAMRYMRIGTDDTTKMTKERLEEIWERLNEDSKK